MVPRVRDIDVHFLPNYSHLVYVQNVGYYSVTALCTPILRTIRLFPSSHFLFALCLHLITSPTAHFFPLMSTSFLILTSASCSRLASGPSPPPSSMIRVVLRHGGCWERWSMDKGVNIHDQQVFLFLLHSDLRLCIRALHSLLHYFSISPHLFIIEMTRISLTFHFLMNHLTLYMTLRTLVYTGLIAAVTWASQLRFVLDGARVVISLDGGVHDSGRA
ncbi:hypothetical protein BDQ17DRAFT_1359149 [Cyathus striatus]|nr:hypothetical protein BDQ17DRAFT_1359149 [Cyathus striatus]